ncbi:MAG: hypothetical protein IKN96_06925 [Oscillibacter sp.]|nr:hypothetical protein [Oscillibacter sp.]
MTVAARVSAQKRHAGRNGRENSPKKRTSPPAAPKSMKPLSSPSAGRSRKASTAAVSARP